MQNSKSRKFNNGGSSGFTLVELMVSIIIFLLAMGVVAQLFLFSMRAHRFLLAHSQMIGEMSYNLEHITRGLRMAKKSQITDSCLSKGENFRKTATGNGGIKFQNLNATGDLDCVEYYLNGTILMERRINTAQSFDLPLTSPNVKILAFSIADGVLVGGWDQNDNLQPRVTIYIKAQDKEGGISENQITISQRDMDIAQ